MAAAADTDRRTGEGLPPLAEAVLEGGAVLGLVLLLPSLTVLPPVLLPWPLSKTVWSLETATCNVCAFSNTSTAFSYQQQPEGRAQVFIIILPE